MARFFIFCSGFSGVVIAGCIYQFNRLIMSTPQRHSPVYSEASSSSGKPLLKWQEPVVLLSVSIKRLIILAFFPSISSLILVFLVGFGIDYLQLLNYEWTCGVSIFLMIYRMDKNTKYPFLFI